MKQPPLVSPCTGFGSKICSLSLKVYLVSCGSPAWGDLFSHPQTSCLSRLRSQVRNHIFFPELLRRPQCVPPCLALLLVLNLFPIYPLDYKLLYFFNISFPTELEHCSMCQTYLLIDRSKFMLLLKKKSYHFQNHL